MGKKGVMTSDVYEKLAKHLDDLPSGYPRTKNGAEMRILRRLFTPEEAELAVHISLIEETAEVIARRARIPVKEAARILENMEKKGLIYVHHRKSKPPRYQASGYVIGFFEFQVNKLNPELIKDVEEYTPHWFDKGAWKKVPQLRTIPVNESIQVKNEVLPYEHAEQLIQDEEIFAVAPCICRQEQKIQGHGCDRPLETCLVFGRAAEYYIHNNLGRKIDREEVRKILKTANKTGLVLQPSNAKEPSNICTCCGCCCGVLRNIKRHPRPATLVWSPCIAELDTDVCNGCGICVSRCQMDALSLDNEYAVLNSERCIGCGLCISTCPTHALRLVRKPKSEQRHIPKNIVRTNIKLGRVRGKLSLGKMLQMVLKSVIDRIVATKRD